MITRTVPADLPKLQNKTANFVPVGKNAMKVMDFNPLIKDCLPYTGKFKVVVRWFE